MNPRYLLAALPLLLASFLAAPAMAANCPALLNHTEPRLQDGVPQPLCQYQGKALLVVNTASFLAYTDQYEGIESVYDKYKSPGLIVLDFPANDSAPGSRELIAQTEQQLIEKP